MDLLVDLAIAAGIAVIAIGGLATYAIAVLPAYFETCTCRRAPWEDCPDHPREAP